MPPLVLLGQNPREQALYALHKKATWAGWGSRWGHELHFARGIGLAAAAAYTSSLLAPASPHMPWLHPTANTSYQITSLRVSTKLVKPPVLVNGNTKPGTFGWCHYIARVFQKGRKHPQQMPISHTLEEAKGSNSQVTHWGLTLEGGDATHRCWGKLKGSKELSTGPILT